jgi:hypothetical protein
MNVSQIHSTLVHASGTLFCYLHVLQAMMNETIKQGFEVLQLCNNESEIGHSRMQEVFLLVRNH